MSGERFGRILLKLSGEALMGSQSYGTDGAEVDRIATQVASVRERGVEVAIVVGAGNIYRGLAGAAAGMDRATGDYMGMLATVLNALTLQDSLERMGQHTRVMSAIDVKEVAEPYIGGRAAGAGDPRRGDPDGEERGGRRLRLRPGDQPGRQVHPQDHPPGSDRA